MSLFPFDEIRGPQQEFVQDVQATLEQGRSLIAQAPTGLGKTAATLAPALEYALKHKKTIFFLTSRHTQHAIALETLQKIKDKHGVQINCVDLIGKKHMCLMAGVGNLHSGEFFDYCRKVREDNACEYYNNARDQGKLTVLGKSMLEDLKGLLSVHELKERSSYKKLCPYEMAIAVAKDAQVIISDYFYVFNPKIFEGFLSKINKSVEDCIIIVDEGHNVPDRIRDLMTAKLSEGILTRATKEANKHNFLELETKLAHVRSVLQELAKDVKDERLVTREQFVANIPDYIQLVQDLFFAADMVRVQAKVSFIGYVATFLQAWQNDDHGYVRYLESTYERKITLFYKCLDPSLLTKETIHQCHTTILMSGTLVPPEMYRDLLGFSESTLCKSYASPFPKENRLPMIIPQTSTRFATRSTEQYMQIAKIVSDIVNTVPGNSAVFFPSYQLRDQIQKYIVCTKTMFIESSELSSEEKQDLLERFKKYHKTGAVLLGVTGGSFGEGIDLPGEYLKAVVVVGLPLKQPTLETKALIQYYDGLFGRGWDYGYTFPALNLVMQAAGRCIRTMTDRGVLVFLDERYAWSNYMKCFPADWKMVITGLYKGRIEEFYGIQPKTVQKSLV